jgi:UDP-2,4-diacetamido-2,4,6-trideoxy-beta-L-altropyranose hydrolase
MKIVFRTDASTEIGIGHVMRCLTLALELNKDQHDISFICRAHKGHMEPLLKKSGFIVHLLALHNSKLKLGASWEEDSSETIAILKDQKADWLILDHYEIDHQWHKSLRPYVQNIMAIDDLSNRMFDCDLLLDQTFKKKIEDYTPFISNSTECLLGPEYALLRPDFFQLRQTALKKRQGPFELNNILLSVGGMAQKNIIQFILEALNKVHFKKSPTINIVLSSQAPELKEIKKISDSHQLKINVLTDVNNMASLMLEADFSLGAAGSTAWERCTLGLPGVVICTADNQKEILKNLKEEKAHLVYDYNNQKNSNDLAELINTSLKNPELVYQLSKNSSNICNGLGASRVSIKLDPPFAKDGKKVSLRDATEDDIKLVYDWQTAPETRRYALNSSLPTFKEHCAWMTDKLCQTESFYWIVQHDNEDAGVLRLDPHLEGEYFEYLVSIFTAPSKFSLGIASCALKIGQKILNQSTLFAKVLPENEASVSLFQKANFLYQKDIDYFVWTQENPSSF